jgi:hypothetical protein
MSEETGMVMDVKKFGIDFDRITSKTIPQDIIKALWELGWGIIADAIKIYPTVPKEIGDLRASGHVIVKEMDLDLFVGFNSIYAWKMHEGLKDWNWTEPGSGPKYLESKLSMFKNKYIKFIADRIKG